MLYLIERADAPVADEAGRRQSSVRAGQIVVGYSFAKVGNVIVMDNASFHKTHLLIIAEAYVHIRLCGFLNIRRIKARKACLSGHENVAVQFLKKLRFNS
jgi:hypothetical protein